MRPLRIPEAARRQLRIMFVAKHANWDRGVHPEDGTHAVYHREIRTVLEDLGLNLQISDRYESLFDRPDVDFVFPLLNRGGFLNSEMLLPLLCSRHGIPYLGASPILRGLSDDKHLTKLAAQAHRIPTAPWAIFRRGAPLDRKKCPAAERWVIKPNASSASWGISAADNWDGVRDAIVARHKEGHDAIVEPFITGHDIEMSVITVNDQPVILPTQIVLQSDPSALRSYGEKRNLRPDQSYSIQPFNHPELLEQVEIYTRRLMGEFVPFDYGRFEFRLDIARGQIEFLEVNLNCNLWSRKTIAIAAAQAGWSHPQLIETILAESLRRQGLLDMAVDLAA
ncbi:MAG TPA: phosphoribosylglycinamide synthetase [Sphingomonas sp.]|nr:phosphoribosylglycinamide synthetase [Sphingomonas sp.]